MSANSTAIEHFYESIPGFFWFEECYRRLLRSLPTDRPSHFVEIGSFHGRSTCWLGVEVQRRQLPVTIHAVDFWEFPTPTEGAAIHDAFLRNTAPFRDFLTVWHMPSPEAAAHFVDESVDVVFVDGDHTHDGVRGDILAWWPKLKSGGFMAGDDYCMRPVADTVITQFGPSGYILCHGWGNAGGVMQPWPSWIARKD